MAIYSQYFIVFSINSQLHSNQGMLTLSFWGVSHHPLVHIMVKHHVASNYMQVLPK